MRTIPITTAQKVTIEFALPTLFDRILAFVVDFILIVATLGLLWVALLGVFARSSETLMYLILFGIMIPLWMFYIPVMEILNNGRTIGKASMGLQVVKLDGEPPSVSDYLLRWVFRFIDITSTSGVLAVVLIASSEKGQRLGDMLANTTVIKTRVSMKRVLNDLIKIGAEKPEEPQFVHIRRLSDEQTLLLKEVMLRYQQVRNKASRQALEETVERTRNLLEVSIDPKTKPEQFLKEVIRDYILATR